MTMILPQFGALYKTYLEEEAFDNVKTKLIESVNDKLTRRDDEGDWVYKGGDLAELMGVENTCFEASATNFSETLAFVTLDEKNNAVNIKTDHPEWAKETDRAVVLRGAMTELFESDIVEKVREQWKTIGRNWDTIFYGNNVPAGLDDELKVDPNRIIDDRPAIFHYMANKQVDMVELLLQHHRIAPFVKVGVMSKTVLTNWYLRGSEYTEMWKMLILHPKLTLEDILFQDGDGFSTVRLVKESGNPDLLKILNERIVSLGGNPV